MGSGRLGSAAANSTNENRSWLSCSAKASAGESVRIQISCRLSLGNR